MSCFKGTFNSLPGVTCDEFSGINQQSDQFFLSHCHSDHMRGLEVLTTQLRKRNAIRVNHRIYCSMISKAFIVRKYPYLDERYVKDLFPDEPVVIDVFDRAKSSLYKLRVTAISANHCPGSIMFLFEKLDDDIVTHRILYTGDFRFETLSDLTLLKSLHLENKEPIAIDEMFLDTTFCSPRYLTFPSRAEAISRIWDLVHSWVRKTGMYRNHRAKHVILLQLPAQYGSEAILKDIYEKSGLKWRIHVNHNKFQDYLCSDELGDCTDSDARTAQWIHACSWKDQNNANKSGIGRKNSNSNFNQLPCQSGPFEVRTIKPCAMFFSSDRLEEEANDEDRVVSQCGEKFFRVCYSCHSSLTELLEFVKHFKPRKVVPCVVPKDSSMSQVIKSLESVLSPNDIDLTETQDVCGNFNTYDSQANSSEIGGSSSGSSCDVLNIGTKKRRSNSSVDGRLNNKVFRASGKSSDDEDDTAANDKRKLFKRSKSNKANYSMPVGSSSPNRAVPNQQSRRASLPHNLKIPLIKITPSSPSPDPNHPDYPEFFENTLYMEMSKQMSTTSTDESSAGGACASGSRNERDMDMDKEVELKLSPEDTPMGEETSSAENSRFDMKADEVITLSSDPIEADDLDSTPELEEVFQQVQTDKERRNCQRFAQLEGLEINF